MSEGGFGAVAGRSIRWLAAGQLGKRFSQIITTAVLAHLLSPEDFGVVALALVVTDFGMIFRDLGTTSAVIRQETVDRKFLSTVFWTNLGFAALTAACIALGAWPASWFFREPALVSVLQVLSLSFLIAGSGILQQALLERRMQFERLAGLELVAAIGGALVGIACAYNGFGVWSLVAQQLTTQTTQTMLIWRASKWRPSWIFDPKQLRGILSFSLHLTGSQVIDFVWRNAAGILIGRYLGSTALGYYSIAYRVMMYPLQSVSAVVGRALFPVYSKFQHEPARFRKAYVRVAGAIALITFPMLAGVVAMRHTFVATLLGPGWEPVAKLLLILGPIGMSESIGLTTGMIFLTTGRTDWMLRWSLVACFASIAGYALGLRWGIEGVAWGEFAVTALLFIPSFAIPFSLVELKWTKFLGALRFPLASCVLMFGTVALSERVIPLEWLSSARFGILIFMGILSYTLGMFVWGKEQVTEIWETVVSSRRKTAASEAVSP